MALTNQGNIRYTLKTPYRDGTTHITPASRGKDRKPLTKHNPEAHSPAKRRVPMFWVQRLKHVFAIDIETCIQCGRCDIRISSKQTLSASMPALSEW